MRPYVNELKSVTIVALKQEWLAMHHLQKHLPFLSIMKCLICCWQDSHVKTENTILAGHRGTNVLPMAYKSKALNPNYTAGPDPISVSAYHLLFSPGDLDAHNTGQNKTHYTSKVKTQYSNRPTGNMYAVH